MNLYFLLESVNNSLPVEMVYRLDSTRDEVDSS